MEILSDSDATTFMSETLSTTRASAQETVSQEAQDESSTGTGRSSSEGGKEPLTDTDSDSDERVTSLNNAMSRHVSLSLDAEARSTDGSYDDSLDKENPFREFMRQCCQAVQKNNQTKMEEADVTSTSTDVTRFCTNCVKNLQSRSKLRDLRSAATLGPPRDPNPCSSIPICTDVLERLKMERLLHSMREVTQIPEYNRLKDCSTCRDIKKDVDERAFVRDKVRHLRNRLTEEKLQRHLVEMKIGNLSIEGYYAKLAMPVYPPIGPARTCMPLCPHVCRCPHHGILSTASGIWQHVYHVRVILRR